MPVQPLLYYSQNLSFKQLKHSGWWQSVRLLPVHLNLVLLIHSVLHTLLKNLLYNEGNTLQPLADSLAQRPDIFISGYTLSSKLPASCYCLVLSQIIQTVHVMYKPYFIYGVPILLAFGYIYSYLPSLTSHLNHPHGIRLCYASVAGGSILLFP